MLSAVNHLHHNNIVHRDLKIENILIDQTKKVKIIDFNLSNFFTNYDKLNTFCGSLQFAAPELLRGISYDGPEIDVYSLGVILYVMCNGCLPFDHGDIKKLHMKIKKGVYGFKRELSGGVKEVIRGMMEGDVEKRWCMGRVMGSAWVCSREDLKREEEVKKKDLKREEKECKEKGEEEVIDSIEKVFKKEQVKQNTTKHHLSKHLLTTSHPHNYLHLLNSLLPNTFQPNTDLSIKMCALVRNVMGNRRVGAYVFEEGGDERLYRFIEGIKGGVESEVERVKSEVERVESEGEKSKEKEIKVEQMNEKDCGGQQNDTQNDTQSNPNPNTIPNTLPNTQPPHTISHYIIFFTLKGTSVRFKLTFYFNLKNYFVCVRKVEGDEVLFGRVLGLIREVVEGRVE